MVGPFDRSDGAERVGRVKCSDSCWIGDGAGFPGSMGGQAWKGMFRFLIHPISEFQVATIIIIEVVSFICYSLRRMLRATRTPYPKLMQMLGVAGSRSSSSSFSLRTRYDQSDPRAHGATTRHHTIALPP